jgi:hypothetical protein
MVRYQGLRASSAHRRVHAIFQFSYLCLYRTAAASNIKCQGEAKTHTSSKPRDELDLSWKELVSTATALKLSGNDDDDEAEIEQHLPVKCCWDFPYSTFPLTFATDLAVLIPL